MSRFLVKDGEGYRTTHIVSILHKRKHVKILELRSEGHLSLGFHKRNIKGHDQLPQ